MKPIYVAVNNPSILLKILIDDNREHIKDSILMKLGIKK